MVALALSGGSWAVVMGGGTDSLRDPSPPSGRSSAHPSSSAVFRRPGGLLLALALAVLACELSAPPARAYPNLISNYQVDLGPPPTSVADADATRDARNLAALQVAACGYEQRFLDDAPKHENGEDTGKALVAKTGFLRLGLRNCVFVNNLPLGFDTVAFNKRYGEQFGPDCADPISYVAYELASQIENNEGIHGGHLRTTFVVSAVCLRQQVNWTIFNMQAKPQIGSAHLPCHLLGDQLGGEWDVTVRELVRLYYLSKTANMAPGGSILDPATETHLFNDLLTIDGAPGPDD